MDSSVNRILKMWLETDEERDQRLVNEHKLCVVKGCKNEPLEFSKYCHECYDEKYTDFMENI